MSSLRAHPHSPPSARREALIRAGLSGGPNRARQGYALALITAVLALLGGLLPALALISRDAWQQILEPGPADVDTLVMAGSGPVALAFTAWLLAAVVASAAAALIATFGPMAYARPGANRVARCAGVIAPALLRHGVAALLGVTLLAAPAAAATGELNSASPLPPAGRSVSSVQATGLTAAWPGRPVRPPAPVARDGDPGAEPANVPGYAYEALSGRTPVQGWMPAVPGSQRAASRPGSDIGLVAASGQHRRLDDDGLMVVRRGDTLWSIAARSLGPGANEAEIASEWPRWFTENKEVIGPDPDRIDPGQRLRPPPVPGWPASDHRGLREGRR